MRRVAKGRVATLTLAIAVVPAGVVIAQTAGPKDGQAERAALEEFCAESGPCMIVNGHADPSATDSTQLATPGEVLASGAKGPDACPSATAAYEAAEVEVDAYVGSCPDANRAAIEAGQVSTGQLAPGEVPK